MVVNSNQINSFINANLLRRNIAEVFRKSGFQIGYVFEEESGSRWGMYLKLPKHLQTLFGTGREILVWVVQSGEWQARTVTQADTIIGRERPRLCEDFAIVVTHDRKTENHASETATSLDTIFLGYCADDFLSFEPHGQRDFISTLQQRLYSRDLYDLPTAVTRSEDFFGRKSTITELATRLREGGRHMGVFGLRKIGKTSMLYRLISVLQSGDLCYIAHIDIERIDAINPSAEYLLWSLGESIYDSHRHIRGKKGLLLFGKYRLFSDVSSPGDIFERFDHDIKVIMQSTSRKLVLMFDEIELLSPSGQKSLWGDSFVRVWRLLRGLDQQSPNRLSYFVTGTNPSLFEVNRVNGLENPVYNYFSVEYLKPLTEGDVDNLLAGLGGRMGLAWEPEAVFRVWQSTGGHPALVRGVASLVHRSQSERRTSRTAVRRKDVDGAIGRFLNERATLISQLIAVLQEQYEDEYHLLELLAHGKIGEFREFAEFFPSDTAHLIGYGLCSHVHRCVGLDIELLQTFLQRQGKRLAATPQGDNLEFRPGETVAGYHIEASIGSPGGFARVYKATSGEGQVVALKVLKNGLLTALQREVEPLQEIDHPHVVKIFDFGTSDQGNVFLVMEFLEGQTLRYYCTKSTKASEKEAVEWLYQILTAMTHFHPNEGKVDELRKRDELSPRELVELEESRHGFVHRDIKPENIVITDRGAVVIDFNISSRASSAVVTQSFTPGYLPPDGVGLHWTPDLDLYQLGVTFLQICVGHGEPNEGSLDDLRTLAKEDLSPGLASLLLQMTAPNNDERVGTAWKALGLALRVKNQIGY